MDILLNVLISCKLYFNRLVCEVGFQYKTLSKVVLFHFIQ